MELEKKKCPFCGKEIMATAKKCRYCGKWLDDATDTPDVNIQPGKVAEKTKSRVRRIGVVLNRLFGIILFCAGIAGAYLFYDLIYEEGSAIQAELTQSILIIAVCSVVCVWGIILIGIGNISEELNELKKLIIKEQEQEPKQDI